VGKGDYAEPLCLSPVPQGLLDRQKALFVHMLLSTACASVSSALPIEHSVFWSTTGISLADSLCWM
jgi:hypothetical protein